MTGVPRDDAGKPAGDMPGKGAADAGRAAADISGKGGGDPDATDAAGSAGCTAAASPNGDGLPQPVRGRLGGVERTAASDGAAGGNTAKLVSDVPSTPSPGKPAGAPPAARGKGDRGKALPARPAGRAGPSAQ